MNIIKKIWFFFKRVGNDLNAINNTNSNIHELLCEYILYNELHNNPKYKNSKKLNKYEYKVFSQNGEDGIIEEIFNRIGTTNKFFVEFGAGDGLANNTTYLLVKNWKGCWIEANKKSIDIINQKFDALIKDKRLIVKHAFITSENLEYLFEELKIPKECDLLSIDIDGNDYWIWKNIEKYNPRVVIIEYNALFPPHISWIMKYNPNHMWDETCYHGSSLKSLELLGLKKGYKLVACNFTGSNAFFIRGDLVKDRFFNPFTAENHYESPRYYLDQRVGHRRNFGNFVYE